jgi:RNA polymerase sigma-70 factor (ECF subfamily)
MTSWRQHRTDRMTESYSDERASTSHAPRETDADAISDSERAVVVQALAALPAEFREVFVLREIQGLSYAQISTVTRAPIGTVMSRLSRARRRLAAALASVVREQTQRVPDRGSRHISSWPILAR